MIVQTLTSDTAPVRVHIHHDENAEPPDYCGQSYVYRRYDRRGVFEPIGHVDTCCGGTDTERDALLTLVETLTDGYTVEWFADADQWGSPIGWVDVPALDLQDALTLISAMHGDVVSIDTEQPHNDTTTYLAITTRAQCAAWQVDPEQAATSATDTLETWRQWATGDVYGITGEVATTVTYTDPLGVEHVEVEWDAAPDGNVWGLYGDDYAEQEARALLASLAEEVKEATA